MRSKVNYSAGQDKPLMPESRLNSEASRRVISLVEGGAGKRGGAGKSHIYSISVQHKQTPAVLKSMFYEFCLFSGFPERVLNVFSRTDLSLCSCELTRRFS